MHTEEYMNSLHSFAGTNTVRNIWMLVCVCLYSGHIDTAIRVHYMDANKTAREEARRQLNKNAAWNLEQVLATTRHKTPTVRPPASYHENYCTCVYVHVRPLECILSYLSSHLRIWTSMDAHECTEVNTYIYTHAHTRRNTFTSTWKPPPTHTHMHARALIRTHSRESINIFLTRNT